MEKDNDVRYEITLPMEGHTGKTLRNLINILFSKEKFIKKSFKLEEDFMDEDFVKIINEENIESIEDFSEVAYESGIENCSGIEFDFDEGTIIFKFLKGEVNPEKMITYKQFVKLINERAQNIEYVPWNKIKTDNQEFSFRTWLLKIGMIGEKYKIARMNLLRNLNEEEMAESDRKKE